MPGQQLQSDDFRYSHRHGQHLHEQRVSKFSPFTMRNDEGGKEAWRLCELGELDTGCVMTVRVRGPQGWASELLNATACGGMRAPRVAQVALDLARCYTRPLERGKHGGGLDLPQHLPRTAFLAPDVLHACVMNCEHRSRSTWREVTHWRLRRASTTEIYRSSRRVLLPCSHCAARVYDQS